MTKLNFNKLFVQTVAKCIVCLAVLSIVSCECPYLEERNSQYSSSKGDHLTADLLTGLWQCYYPMYVGDVEFKELRIFSDGKADIIMEDVGGSAYYAETFAWRYDGRYITFTKGNTVYQFQITGYLWPELYLRDSRGKYTWAWRRPEECLTQ